MDGRRVENSSQHVENYEELRHAAEAGDVSGSEAKLHPGTDGAYEVRLLRPPAIDLDDQDLRAPIVISPADLDAARGSPLRRDAFQSAAS